MSESVTLEVDGVEMTSTRDAARRVGISHDYIARLARQRNVFGTKVGRLWYVDLASLQNYLAAIEMEKRVRSKLLKEERRRDLEVRQSLVPRETCPQSSLCHTVVVFGQSTSVLALALLLGVVVHTAVQYQTVAYVAAAVSQSSSSLTESLTWPITFSSATIAMDSNLNISAAAEEGHGSADSESKDGLDMLETSPLAEVVATGPLVLVGKRSVDDTVSYLQSLFSDPVTVTVAEDGVRGTVLPQSFDGHSGAAVDILLIPNDAGSMVQVE